MFTTVELQRTFASLSANLPDGRWVPLLPYPGPLTWRLRDAWEVVMGRAEAVRNTTVNDK